MGALLARLTAGRTQAHIRHVTPVPPGTATGPVAAVYAQVIREFGMLAPPVSLHSPAPDTLAAAWLMLRESLLATGPADRAAKETVATAVSLDNACPYCVDVHGTALHGLVRGGAVTALIGGGPDTIADPRLRQVARWARDGGAAQRPELVGVAVTFHYLNRMVNVFLTDSPLPPTVPSRLRAGILRTVGTLMAPVTRRRRTPGSSLGLLPAAPLPADLAWAAGRPTVAAAFARAAAAIDAAGRRCVPVPVRQLVRAELAGWDGRPLPPVTDRFDAALAGLAEADRPAGRLALLTALASYRVDDRVVARARRSVPDDASLVRLVSWASLSAARRLGGRYAPTAVADRA
jgi:hypothetical protein